MPSFFWTATAEAGKVWSGVAVASTIMSMSAGVSPALASAAFAASKPRSEVNSPSAATRRSRMPVRCRIHSSDVSTIFERSSLERIFSGR